jgi:signal recognition particle subunit SRP54
MDDGFFKKTEAIIQSMTLEERRNPTLLTEGRSKASRKRRIAKGSSTKVEEVNELLRQFEQAKTVMKQLTSGKGRGMLGGLLR